MKKFRPRVRIEIIRHEPHNKFCRCSLTGNMYEKAPVVQKLDSTSTRKQYPVDKSWEIYYAIHLLKIDPTGPSCSKGR